MREPTAKTIADLLLRQSAEQNEILRTIKTEASGDFINARAMMAARMGAICLEVMRSIYAAHPGLNPRGMS